MRRLCCCWSECVSEQRFQIILRPLKCSDGRRRRASLIKPEMWFAISVSLAWFPDDCVAF